MAINFVTDDDKRALQVFFFSVLIFAYDLCITFFSFQDIEKFYNTQIDEMPMNVADLI